MSANMIAVKLRHEFFEKHKNADEIVFDSRNNLPIGAIYYSHDWYSTPEMHANNLRHFFKAVQAAEFEHGLTEDKEPK